MTKKSGGIHCSDNLNDISPLVLGPVKPFIRPADKGVHQIVRLKTGNLATDGDLLYDFENMGSLKNRPKETWSIFQGTLILLWM